MNPELIHLNTTELQEIIRQRTGNRLRRSVPRERLIHLIETKEPPLPEELAGTNYTRIALQNFISESWDWVNSQLPCTGQDRGKCTIYPCPEGRHLDCYTANIKHKI